MKKQMKQIAVFAAAITAAVFILTACGGNQNTTSSAGAAGASAASEAASVQSGTAPEIKGLTFDHAMEKTAATGFNVYYYNDGYKVISTTFDSRNYLIVPEGKTAPEGTEESFVVLRQPLDQVYLTATSALSLIHSIGAMDAIKMTGTAANGWYLPYMKEAMESGQIIFAGKYSEPDYEMLIDKGCDLAIESTMILHAPKVQEMLEKMDIPVFIDSASREDQALGRAEWVKVYGALFNKESEAEEQFASQEQIVLNMKDAENTEKTVAFFYINTEGSAVIRNSNDYIASMIETGGGRYAFRDMEVPAGSSSSIKISMEEFYATAVDADYLIYNAAIDNPIKSVDELIAKNPLFADFKAVKEGNVWCAKKAMYQSTDSFLSFVTDISHMLTDGNESEMVFLTKVN